MPIPVIEEQQIIRDTTFDEDIEYSPSALREWFTTNRVVRCISHLMGLGPSRGTRIKATRYGELYVRWAEAPLAIHLSKSAEDVSDSLSTSPVSEGELWIVERITASNIDGTSGHFRIEAHVGAVVPYLVLEYNLAAGETIYVDGPITMLPNSYLVAVWGEISAGNTLHFHVYGRKLYLR